MKILHIVDFHPDYHDFYGGAEIATMRLVKELEKNKIENYYLITPPTKDKILEKNVFVTKTIYNYIDFKKPKSLKNRILRNFNFFKIIFPFDIIVFLKSRKILKKIKPEIVHFHNFKKISFAPLIWVKLYKIKSFLSIYDYWFFCPNETLIDLNNNICKKYNSIYCFKCFKIQFRFRIFLPLRKKFFNFFLKKIDGYIFLSNSSFKIGREYGLSIRKSKVIPQIFEEFKDKPYELPKGNILLYVGWVQYRKGLHILIEALSNIKKEIPDVLLYVIGEIENVEKKYVENIFKMIKDKNLSENVVIKGKLHHQEIKKYFKESKVVVIPEQWENMSPVVLVESMFNKKAIVASRIGGIKEFIEDGKDGFLCEPQNIYEFAEKIKILLKNNELVKKFGENAFKKAKEIWDNEKNINKIIEFYKEKN
ncbi:MAG: glycosyltransferase family 4 protein [Candidatus Omnitrophica bacterium]|nr:glycosyltransferase family 4 protein [Candidatus Omnitrophota bacterium]